MPVGKIAARKKVARREGWSVRRQSRIGLGGRVGSQQSQRMALVRQIGTEVPPRQAAHHGIAYRLREKGRFARIATTPDCTCEEEGRRREPRQAPFTGRLRRSACHRLDRFGAPARRHGKRGWPGRFVDRRSEQQRDADPRLFDGDALQLSGFLARARPDDRPHPPGAQLFDQRVLDPVRPVGEGRQLFGLKLAALFRDGHMRQKVFDEAQQIGAQSDG